MQLILASIAFSGIVLAGFVFLTWWFNRRWDEFLTRQKSDQTLTEWLKSMQETLTQTNKSVTETLQRQFQSQQAQLKSTATEFAKMQREMGQFAEIGRTMRQLQEFLQSPKLRGNIGEEILNDLLKQMLPRQSFHLQYSFQNGARVDACIETEVGKLPVDAKFPMSAWRKLAEAESDSERQAGSKQLIKDIKLHIDAVAEKYIRPDEGTMNMALMYIPSESVFYELTHLPEILEHARQKRVVPVSPTTFYAYLQAILASFQQRQLMRRSKEILTLLQGLTSEHDKTRRQLEILGKHLQNAYNSFSTVTTSFTLLGQKLLSTHTLESGTEGKSASSEPQSGAS